MAERAQTAIAANRGPVALSSRPALWAAPVRLPPLYSMDEPSVAQLPSLVPSWASGGFQTSRDRGCIPARNGSVAEILALPFEYFKKVRREWCGWRNDPEAAGWLKVLSV